MNKNTPPTQNPESSTHTPWPRNADVHPSAFISSARNQWPGLPRLAAVTPHVEKSDKKEIAAILGRFDAATELRRKNDIPGHSQCVRDYERNSGSYDDVAVQCEVYRRELAAMSPELFNEAVAGINAAKLEAGSFAAGFCERLSEKLYAEFEIEALAAESRYEKYSQPLESKIYADEWIDVHVLHSDPILTGLYLEFWYAANHFPAEMRSAKLWNGSSVEWLRDITA